MPSAELEIVNDLLRSQSFSSLTLDEQRALLAGGSDDYAAGTRVEEVDAHGIPCEWVTAAGASARVTVLALRGGGYCLGSLASNRRFCSLLSEHTGGTVLNVGYRNAPEHPYPAAFDDAVAAYRWLMRDGDAVPGATVVAGNSAGGGLALACLLALRDAGDPMPAGGVAISPWTDLAGTGESLRTNAATEVMLDPAGVASTAALYAPAARLRDAYVSPLYGDPTGLPPLLLQVSGAEILRDDSLRFADRARAAGVRVTLEVVEDMPHVWHLFAGLLPEADAALQSLGRWVRATVSPVARDG